MANTLEIAFGIWLGGSALLVTFYSYFALRGQLERNRRYGYPWWSISP